MGSFVIPGELIPGNTGYICVICENPLIGAVETSCQHKFCSYCINLWKKHHTLCPICTHDMGKLISRHDIDRLIERFFSTSNSVSREERCNAIKQRNKVTNLVFGENSSISEMNSLIDHFKPLNGQELFMKSSSKNGNVQHKKEIVRLLGETDRFERQLQSVYSKILTTGERLTAREDLVVARLCGTSIGGKQSPLHYYKEFGQSGPPHPTVRAARPTKADFGQQHFNVKTHKDQLEIDALLELTDDVLQIDKFLKENSFEVLTQVTVDNVTDNEIYEDDDTNSIFNDETLRITTDRLLEEVDNVTASKEPFKIHPEVQKYLDKFMLKIPNLKTKQSVHALSHLTTTSPVEDTIECDGEEGGVRNLKREASHGRKTMATSKGVDLTNKILQCRESLLNLKQQSQHEMLQKLTFKPLNFFRSHKDKFEEEQTSDDYIGPMGDREGRPSFSSSSPAAHIEQVPPVDDTIRKIGREPVRPMIRRRREFTQCHYPRLVTFRPPKVFEIGPTFSLPAIPIRDCSLKNDVKTKIRTRPQTSIECMKSVESLRR